MIRYCPKCKMPQPTDKERGFCPYCVGEHVRKKSIRLRIAYLFLDKQRKIWFDFLLGTSTPWIPKELWFDNMEAEEND